MTVAATTQPGHPSVGRHPRKGGQAELAWVVDYKYQQDANATQTVAVTDRSVRLAVAMKFVDDDDDDDDDWCSYLVRLVSCRRGPLMVCRRRGTAVLPQNTSRDVHDLHSLISYSPRVPRLPLNQLRFIKRLSRIV